MRTSHPLTPTPPTPPSPSGHIVILLVLFVGIVFSLLCSGCVVSKSLVQSVQPKGNKIYPQEPKLFDIQAQNITFSAPVRTTTTVRPDGYTVTTTEPIMETTVTTNVKTGEREETTKPVLARFWVKDQMAKQPTTILDFLTGGLRLFAVGYGLNQAFGSINSMSHDIAREPTIVQTPPERTNFVTVDGEGGVAVDRG